MARPPSGAVGMAAQGEQAFGRPPAARVPSGENRRPSAGAGVAEGAASRQGAWWSRGGRLKASGSDDRASHAAARLCGPAPLLC